MQDRLVQLEQAAPLAGLLGYLNFSDGKPDARWQKQLNDAFAALAGAGSAAPWAELLDLLNAGLDKLREQGSPAFRDVAHARAAIALSRSMLAAYRRHHVDLLAHVPDATLFQPFFLARVCEAVLAARAADPQGAGEAAVLARLNDFVGYRPIAVLESRPRGEPYDHERIRPVPLYLRGAGVGSGPYHDVVARALDILGATEPDLLAEAQFDLTLLDELALDARAYDHGHPVNRRPNYVFGEWDPHHLDNQARYRRYVIRQITIDGLLSRVANHGERDRDELLVEAAAVLAGTILMASGISGWGPAAHDSTTSLATLLPRVARLRDAFYERLLDRLPAAHADRLSQEKGATRQAFGAARQHLNTWLTRQRALQLQQRSLALLFAEMGFPQASLDEARRIPAVSVRLLSEVLGRLAVGELEVSRGELDSAAGRLPEVMDLLRRGMDCGAFIDPWNILGFQGLFPLSPAREDAVRDPRADELAHMVEQTFNLYARLMSESAAAGKGDLARSLRKDMQSLAEWWDRFATTAVSEVRRVHGGEAASSATQVAKALARWRDRGEAAADLAFWRGRLEGFRTAKAFALVVETLLRKGDFRASLALLLNWLSQGDQVPLEEGVHSFPSLALRWMLTLTGAGRADADRPPVEPTEPLLDASERRALVIKFFDYLEANAEDYWEIPNLGTAAETLEIPPRADDEDLFQAAYEGVTYQDTTDDQEGAVAEGGPRDHFDLEEEAPGIERRLRFLGALARLWQVAARYLADAARTAGDDSPLPGWLATAQGMRARLVTLVDAIHAFPVPEPSGEVDSLVEFDRRRMVKEQLLHAAVTTCLDMTFAEGGLRGAAGLTDAAQGAPDWEAPALQLEQALFAGGADHAREALTAFIPHFQKESLLFTPLSEGGSPRQILRVRRAQTVLRGLLANLPRLGLLRETYELLRAARTMEQAHPPQGRGVTEFNHFFQAAFQSAVESVVASAADWPAEQGGDEPLIDLLERVTAPFLALWVDHSRTLQLSVLETVTGDVEWRALREFVRRYGADLFHARFMTLGNLRGILHRGVAAFLADLGDNPDPLHPVRLLNELDRVGEDAAVRRLELVLRAIVENYEEYKDYNTTTTQSDYGENLHVLLDFLRLKTSYERYAWQLRPLVLAHEVLARFGRHSAALHWERKFVELTRENARGHLEQLDRLEKSHAVHLSTVRDRLAESFVKPLALDRLCASIEPAMAEVAAPGSRPAFTHLREQLAAYTEVPTGVGLDVPYWLRRLEAEVQRVHARHATVVTLAENFFRVPRSPVNYEDVLRQFSMRERPALP